MNIAKIALLATATQAITLSSLNHLRNQAAWSVSYAWNSNDGWTSSTDGGPWVPCADPNAPGAAPAGPAPAGPAPNYKDFTMLQKDAHNELRHKHHVPPLEYDEDLAKGAQEWAEAMAGPTGFQHSGGNYGENLAMNSDKNALYTTDNATAMWYSEISDYDFNDPGFGGGTGHFT